MPQTPEEFLKLVVNNTEGVDELKEEKEPITLDAFKDMMADAMPVYFKSSPMTILLSDPMSGGVLIGLVMAYATVKGVGIETLKDVILQMGGSHIDSTKM